MTEHAMRSMVERQSCEVLGARYSLRLEWVAVDACYEVESVRYALRVELNAQEETTTAPIQMHVVVGLGSSSDFPTALDSALRLQLFDSPATPLPNPRMRRMPRWAEAIQPAIGRMLSRAPAA